MLNKLVSFLRRYQMVQPGDTVTCAVSGGADSMALLFAIYLLREKLQIDLHAAHFNHGLRGEESDRDELFVRDFCTGYGIPFVSGTGEVVAGKKGLEAAARNARYEFLHSQPGKIATAHTADDNAETVLMHMVRGTGLKGLGAIAPVNGRLIRPMLCVTRQEVLTFLQEYSIPFVEDSSNQTDAFLRNRLRHYVMPLLYRENPQLAENLSEMALRLREDEQLLQTLEQASDLPDITALREMPGAQRKRILRTFLERSGVKEPEADHVALAESLVFSEKPSARADFPGGVAICRNYDRLQRLPDVATFAPLELPCPGQIMIPELGLQVFCTPAEKTQNEPEQFTVSPVGKIILRPRNSGDSIRLSGGTKTLKKLFIDRKIPAPNRQMIPVVTDDAGVLGVYGIGADQSRVAADVQIRFERVEPSGML